LFIDGNIVDQPPPDIDSNICPSILRANLLLILISTSIFLTSILGANANLVIFHLLKVFIVAVCVAASVT